MSGTVTEQATLGTERPDYTIKAVAEDGVPNSENPADARAGVKNLRFFEDGTEIEPGRAQPECAGTQSCKAVREYKIPTSSRSAGVHHILVTSEDALGHLASRELSYTITHDTAPPEISVSGMPEEGSIVGSHPPMYSVKATDKGLGVTSLVFKVDGEVIEEATQECPNGGCSLEGSAAPELSEISPGEHVLSVVAKDAAGNQSSVSRHVIVEPAPPHISLSGPLMERNGEPLESERGKLRIEAQIPEFAEANGLVAAWSFDEGGGTVAHDATGHGHEGTIEGAGWTSGKFGEALRFTEGPSEECVSVPDSPELQLPHEFTFEAWVRPEGYETADPVISKGLDPGGGDSYSFGIGFTQAGRVEGWAEGENIYSPETIEEDAWTHIAYSYDGERMHIYVDGERVSDKLVGPEELESTGPLWIGCSGPGEGEVFDGKIDEVRIYDRALDEGEVAEDESTPLGPPSPRRAPVAAWSFDEGGGTVAHDATGHGHEGTIEGAGWTSGKFGEALRFTEGPSEECVSVPDSPELQLPHEFTFEAWVRPEGYETADPVISKGLDPGGGDSYSFGIGFTQAGRVEGWAEGENIYSPETIEEDAWTHIAYSYDGERMHIYVDGEQVSDKLVGPEELESTGPLWIGCSGPGEGEVFDGKIDEVRIYDRALDEGAIAEDMDRAVSESDSSQPTEPTISGLNVELEEEEVPGYPLHCESSCGAMGDTYEYDSAAAGPGPHTLTVEAANSLGETTSRTISVDVPEEEAGTPACSAEVGEEPAVATVTAEEAVETVEKALPSAVALSEPGMNETGEERVDPTYSEPEPNLVAEGTPAQSETSVNASGGVSLSGVACITPGSTTPSATEATVINGDSAVFADTGAESDTVVRPTADGVMIDQSIRGPESTEFSSTVKVREGDELVRLESGAIAVIEPPTRAQEEEGTGGDLGADETEAPGSLQDPESLASAESQREDGEFEIAMAAEQTAGTVVAVIAEPWILLFNEEVIPAHIEIAPVIEEPNEYVIHYRIEPPELPAGEAAAIYPIQAVDNISTTDTARIPAGCF